jgi:hypothetical protein
MAYYSATFLRNAINKHRQLVSVGFNIHTCSLSALRIFFTVFPALFVWDSIGSRIIQCKRRNLLRCLHLISRYDIPSTSAIPNPNTQMGVMRMCATSIDLCSRFRIPATLPSAIQDGFIMSVPILARLCPPSMGILLSSDPRPFPSAWRRILTTDREGWLVQNRTFIC